MHFIISVCLWHRRYTFGTHRKSSMKPLYISSGLFVFTVKVDLFHWVFFSVFHSWNRCWADKEQSYWLQLHLSYNCFVTHQVAFWPDIFCCRNAWFLDGLCALMRNNTNNKTSSMLVYSCPPCSLPSPMPPWRKFRTFGFG